jgi:hypothetical protein
MKLWVIIVIAVGGVLALMGIVLGVTACVKCARKNNQPPSPVMYTSNGAPPSVMAMMPASPSQVQHQMMYQPEGVSAQQVQIQFAETAVAPTAVIIHTATPVM